MRKRLVWCAILAAVVSVVCLLAARTISRAPYAYDEADYMYAGQQGFWANYSDRNSLSLVTFVQKGLELTRDDTRRFAMSQYVRASDDIAFYRHYHGPVYAYWISVWHALGVRQEGTFRATGLILHALLTIAIFWLFLRLFPDLPVESAFVAGLVFAMNRTALVTATSITQHLMFEVSACLALMATGEFLRTRQVRFWYVTAALVAVSFAAVEIAVVLLAALIATVTAFEWRNGWKPLFTLMAKGALWFLVTLAVVWPKGVFELNALKGYLYLAYIALYRKTFSPISPVELWGFKLKTYPFEFVLLGMALVSGCWWLSRPPYRKAMAPFLFYACLFLAVTLIITVPYTYYHASLITALAVLTGVMFGEVWNRSGGLGRFAALALVIGSLVALDTEYYRERVVERSSSTLSAQVLSYLNARPDSPRAVFVPQLLIPALHFYRPEIVAVGYEDGDAQGTAQLAQRFGEHGRAEVFCVEPTCRRFEASSKPGTWVRKDPLGLIPGTADMLYVGTVTP